MRAHCVRLVPALTCATSGMGAARSSLRRALVARPARQPHRIRSPRRVPPPGTSLRHSQASRLGRRPQRLCAHLSASACTALRSYAPADIHLRIAHIHPSSPLQTLRRHCRGGICRLCLQRAFSPCMLHIVVSQPESELPPAFCRLDRALSLACSPARQPAPLWPILRATSASAETALVLGSPARYPRASPRPSPQLCP